jgi:integrase
VATVLDCGLRPEECTGCDGSTSEATQYIYIPPAKTINARREIPLSHRARRTLQRRRGESVWVFPAPTASGHIEQIKLKRQHSRACEAEKLAAFVPYVFRHTCLTRWAKILDPCTLAYLAGHSDFGTTKRYVHPNLNTARAALERARRTEWAQIRAQSGIGQISAHMTGRINLGDNPSVSECSGDLRPELLISGHPRREMRPLPFEECGLGHHRDDSLRG